MVIGTPCSGPSLAPLLARQICLSLTDLKVDLKDLTALSLVRITLIFSAVSAGLHQSWYAWRGVSDNALSGVLVMFCGDMLGAMLVLYASKVALSLDARLRGG